jgi:hypothetical protein
VDRVYVWTFLCSDFWLESCLNIHKYAFIVYTYRIISTVERFVLWDVMCFGTLRTLGTLVLRNV